MSLRRLALLALLCLSACGFGPKGAPQALGPVEITKGRITGKSGASLALTTWAPDYPPEAIILALHGYGDFAEGTFERAAAHWARRGIKTYAYDQRGFGANPSRKAWPGPLILESDLLTIAATLRARHPRTRLVVLGHSMGGGIALSAAAHGLDADALILAAPAIAGGRFLGALPRTGAAALAAFIPDRRFTGEGVVEITPTDNRAALIRIARDPRHYAEPSGRELLGLIRTMDRAARAAPSVTLPVLTLTGANDQILAPDAIARVHARIPGPKRLIHYPDGWHWLLRDLQAEQVWEDVADYALAPSQPRPAALP